MSAKHRLLMTALIGHAFNEMITRKTSKSTVSDKPEFNDEELQILSGLQGREKKEYVKKLRQKYAKGTP